MNISIFPESLKAGETVWRAIADGQESVGRTAGEALDALTRQLEQQGEVRPLIVRRLGPDRFFTAEQQQRLENLMSQWRTARAAGNQLPSAEYAELEALIEAELEGSARRVEAMHRDQNP